MKVMFNKRGVSVWVSYVLLTAMVVSLGYLVLGFSREHTEDTVEDLVERGDALTTCQITGVNIQNLCQDTQTLNMDVTNSNDVKVIGLWVRMFDIYRAPQVSSRNITINVQKTKTTKILKQGIIATAEISPIIKVDNKRVICQSRKHEFDDIKVCS